MFKFGLTEQQLDRLKQQKAYSKASGNSLGKVVTASGFGGTGGSGNFHGSGSSGFGRVNSGGQYDVSRYNPVHDHLEIGSIVEDWMPRDQSGMSQLWRLIYLRDAIVGPAIDLYSNLPYSECRLTGIKDPAILRVYEDTMERLDIVTMMPDLVREFLMIGRFCASLIFDARLGVFTDWIVHDPDFLRIEPIPVRGFDPKIDLVASPAMKSFLQSQDPRDLAARSALPPHYFEQFESQGIYRLDPLNTIFVPRRAGPYDYVGTSFLTRIVNFWALEKSLVESTVTNARRRTRAITHVAIGLENIWEPTPEELDAIAGLFIQADEDPVGAVVTTRTGVETNEVKSGADFWKLSDEWAFLTEGKMRALGISDAFLSGDATYNNMETSLSIFMESLRTLRQYMDRRVFYEKIFATLARVHGFVKHDSRSKNIRGLGPNLNYEKALQIPREDLIMPKIQWNKKLQPEGDMNFMEMLQTADAAGVPVTIKQWASAASINLDETMAELPEDAILRKKIGEWRKQFTGSAALEQEVMSSASKLTSLPVWDDNGRFVSLSADKALEVVSHFFSNHKNVMKLTDKKEIMRTISGMVDGDAAKTELMAYLLKRIGVKTTLNIPDNIYVAISEHLTKIGQTTESAKVKKALVKEFQVLARISAKELPSSRKTKLNKVLRSGDVSAFDPKKSVTGV